MIRKVFFCLLFSTVFCACNDHRCPCFTETIKLLSSDNESFVAKTKEMNPTPRNKTIFNSSYSVWGWFSGRYVVIKWNPLGYHKFRVYKRSRNRGKWVEITSEPLIRNEFFDSSFKETVYVVEYKVEALNENGSNVYTYEPLVFVINGKR